jgi:DNA-binding NarL/FixJ family response regulator
MAALRVLLADDHALVRAGMRSLLRDIPGVEVVGEAADGAEALAVAARERPDAVRP